MFHNLLFNPGNVLSRVYGEVKNVFGQKKILISQHFGKTHANETYNKIVLTHANIFN